MKKIILITALLGLTACQQTPNSAIEQPVEQNVVTVTPVPETIIETAKALPEAKLPHQHQDVWQRIRTQLTLEIPDNKAVAKWRNYYLSHPHFMTTISQRAEPFLLYIVEQVEQRNMPIELALLPIVESAYLPYGVSNKSAAGLWQFMPVTAKRFNLPQNWWYDGRRDIVESTRAALDYFAFFHRTLGQDWLNAIAAFNSGEGRVGRAIAKNKKANLAVDFWSLGLPAQTSDYVPKLLAIADILKRSEALNYRFTPIKNSPAVALVTVDSQLDLTLAAQWANTDAAQLLKLNPALNRWSTPPDSAYQLMVPASAAQSVVEKLAVSTKRQRLRWADYKVVAGDSLSVIAVKYGIDVTAIKRLNKLKSNTIRIGQQLTVPLSARDARPAQLVKRSRKRITYVVKNGDNLWNISRKYKVKVQDVVRWNKLSSNTMLQPKQKLKILL